MSRFRQVLRPGLRRELLFYASGEAVNRAFGLLMLPVWTRLFTQQDYGALTLTYTVLGIVAGLLVLGGDTVVARFWIVMPPERRAAGLSAWTMLLFALSTGAVLLLAAVHGRLAPAVYGSDGYTLLFLAALATVPVTLCSRMLAQAMRMQLRPVAFVGTSALLASATVAASLTLVLGFDVGVAGVMLGLIGAETLVLGVRAALIRDSLTSRVREAPVREMLAFGLPLVPVTAAFWAIQGIDRVVLAAQTDLESVAQYSIAAALASILLFLATSLGQAWVPRIYAVYADDPHTAFAQAARAVTVIVAVFGSIGLAISALARPILGILAPAQYAGAAGLVPLMCLGATAYATNVFTATGLTMTGRTRRLAAVSIAAAALSAMIVVTLVPTMGALGAATGTAVGYIFLTGGYLQSGRRVADVVLPTAATAVLCVSLVVATAIMSAEAVQDRPAIGLLVVGSFASLGVFVCRRRHDVEGSASGQTEVRAGRT